MIIIGIDPGASGALAFYDVEEAYLWVYDMPVNEIVRNGKKKREVSAAGIADIIRARIDQQPQVRAFFERVGAMPGQGVTSMFAFGRSAGIVEGVLAAMRVPIDIVTPQAWQKATGSRDGKDGARLRAQQLFPAFTEYFGLKKHDGRADASLLCVYGLGVIGLEQPFGHAREKREGTLVAW
jgi:crossover junction endodeoxyribonuclease RuvC